MKAVYPIIIYPKSSGEATHYVEIPDIDRGTQGETLAECMDMARDALSLWAITETDADEYSEAIDITKASYDDDNIDVTFVAGTDVTFTISPKAVTITVKDDLCAHDKKKDEKKRCPDCPNEGDIGFRMIEVITDEVSISRAEAGCRSITLVKKFR